jgi:regulator of protease activity HflC (stomatin/prohibitin superfamily)
MDSKQIITVTALALVLLFGIFSCNKLLIDVPADRIYVVQEPTGEMHVYDQPGWSNQHFGEEVGNYPKFEAINFDIPEDKRGELNYENAWTDPAVSMYGIKVVFNDNGTAMLFGSVPIEMPTDPETIKMIQEKHGGWESLRQQIIMKQLVSAVTQVGSLMTSREANSERRSDLIGYLEDMVKNGLYKTKVRSEREVDAITRDTVVVKYAVRIEDPNSPGGFMRQALSEITKYNIKVGTPAINRIVFSPAVQDQLTKQQEMTMAIATSKAEALVSQQNAKTSIAEAEAKLAKVSAEMNAEKEKAVIQAQQRMEVAEKDMRAAEFGKRKAILEGEGEAEKKRLLMQADGALNPKLDAWLAAQTEWAHAWAQNKANIVPHYVSGGGGNGNTSSAINDFVTIMGINQARQLGLDLSIKDK